MFPHTGVQSPHLLQLHGLHPADSFTGTCRDKAVRSLWSPELPCCLTGVEGGHAVSPRVLTAPAGEAVSGAGAAAPAAPGGVAGVVPGGVHLAGLVRLAGLVASPSSTGPPARPPQSVDPWNTGRGDPWQAG